MQSILYYKWSKSLLFDVHWYFWSLLMHIKLCKTNYDQRLNAFLEAMKEKWKECFIVRTLKYPSSTSMKFADWGIWTPSLSHRIFATLDPFLFRPFLTKTRESLYRICWKIDFFAGNRSNIYELKGVLGNCKQQGDIIILDVSQNCGMNWRHMNKFLNVIVVPDRIVLKF